MRYQYSAILTGLTDGFNDLPLPFKNFNFRKKNGTTSSLRIVVPGSDLVGDIADRANGEIVVELYGNGVLLAEVARANFGTATPTYGLMSNSISLDGTKQVTYSRAVEPIDLDGLWFARYPNSSNGLWQYQLGGPQYQILPGDTVFYGVHEFTVGDVVWNFDGQRTTVTVNEAAAE